MVVYNSDISLLSLKSKKKDKEKLSNSKNSTRFINDVMRKSQATKFIFGELSGVLTQGQPWVF